MLPFSHTISTEIPAVPLTLMKPEGSGRVRDNIPAKMGAQTQRRESLTGEPRLARGADGVLNLGTGVLEVGRGPLQPYVFRSTNVRGAAPWTAPGLRTPDRLQHRIRSEIRAAQWRVKRHGPTRNENRISWHAATKLLPTMDRVTGNHRERTMAHECSVRRSSTLYGDLMRSRR
jgi:hypothetical protein